MFGGVIVNFIVVLLVYIFVFFYYGDIDIVIDSLKDGYSIENLILKNIGF